MIPFTRLYNNIQAKLRVGQAMQQAWQAVCVSVGVVYVGIGSHSPEVCSAIITSKASSYQVIIEPVGNIALYI